MTDEKVQDIEFTEDEKKQIAEYNKLLEESEEKTRTNILNEIKFANKQDEMVFNRLPLSNRQKEELLFSIYMPDVEI